jgi:hypothetical protein
LGVVYEWDVDENGKAAFKGWELLGETMTVQEQTDYTNERRKENGLRPISPKELEAYGLDKPKLKIVKDT